MAGQGGWAGRELEERGRTSASEKHQEKVQALEDERRITWVRLGCPIVVDCKIQARPLPLPPCLLARTLAVFLA